MSNREVVDLSKVDRDLSKLYPPFKEDIEKLLAECHSKKLNVYVFEAYRSFERQNFLYQQGRTKKGRIVTNADSGYSAHGYGLAVDLVFDGDPVKAGFQWSWQGSYASMGEIVRTYKTLEWAGDWQTDEGVPARAVGPAVFYRATQSNLRQAEDASKALEVARRAKKLDRLFSFG